MTLEKDINAIVDLQEALNTKKILNTVQVNGMWTMKKKPKHDSVEKALQFKFSD
jgi:hypothetical protein